VTDAKSADLSDIEKSAVLLMSIGQDQAAEVLRYLSAQEINRLSAAMARLSSMSTAAVSGVFKEFTDLMLQQTSIGVGGEAYLRGALEKALGAEKAAGLVERIQHGGEFGRIDAVKLTDPRVLVEMIRSEHPQIVAMILGYMEPERAAELIRYLPDDLVDQVVPRLATLDSIPPAAVRELNEALEDLMAADLQHVRLTVGGIKVAANILNRFDATRAQHVLDSIKDVDQDLAQRIKDNMFVFQDLMAVDDRNFQLLLREVDQNLLVPALKGADENLRDKVFRNLSQRAAESLREEIDAKGPMRMSEVEAAQKEILAAAQRLEQEGKIILRTDTNDLVA
jgi:flagellar motor switch protein FliG